MKRKFDCLIVGGGVIGLCAAYYAALKGAEVLVVEKDDILRSAAPASAGLLVPSHYEPLTTRGNVIQGIRFLWDNDTAVRVKFRPDARFALWLLKFLKNSFSETHLKYGIEVLAALHRESFDLHSGLAERAGSRYQFSARGHLALYIEARNFEEAQKEAVHMEKHGIETRVLSRFEVLEMEPRLGPKVVGGIHLPGDGLVSPGAFLSWLAEEAEKMKAEILTRTEVYGFRRSGDRIYAVKTSRGEFSADQVILAAGAWTSRLTGLLGRRLPVEAAKGYSLTFPVQPGVATEVPLVLEDKRIVLSPYRDKVRLISTLDMCGLDQSLDGPRLDRIAAMAKLYLPEMDTGNLMEVRRGLRPCLPDGLPVLGRLSPYSNVLAAAGHDQKGLTFGPVTGLYLSRLLAGESLGFLEKALSPQRF